MDNENSETSTNQLQPGRIIGSKFKLEDKIGQGSFGMIFKCINIETQEPCAIKLEKRNQRHSSMLVREIKVMMEVKNEKGFARLNGYGKEDEYNYVAMTYLGRNLDSLLRKCQGKFKLPCLLNVFEQSLERVKTLHSKNLIHRDIKPENFVIGYGANFNQIHLIDFGLAKYYIDSEGNHIPFFEKKGMIGTARYASSNAHLGHEQSRRDDLEGLGYIMLYFLKGSLPWQSIQADNKEEKYEKIKQMKLTIKLEQLCKDVPSQFIQYFQTVKNLEFTQKPNYDQLFKLLDSMRLEYNIENNPGQVDWQELPEYRQRKKFQTYTPMQYKGSQRENHNNSKNNIPSHSPRNQKISDSQGINKNISRIHRNSVQHGTNLLQIPNKEGTFIQPSVSCISANTSKMNNFNAVSQFDHEDQQQRTNKKQGSAKFNSIGDIEKYEEQKQNKKSQYSNQQQIQQQQQQQQQKNSLSLNKNTQSKQQESVSTKQSKQQEYYDQSEKIGTINDYHKQYPINVMVVKKAYKNGQTQ